MLVEGDDMSDPVSDAVRSITDGHIWLSRAMASRGQYPAIDILESISRVMIDVTDEVHLKSARHVQRMLAVYRDIEDLVNIGAYATGANPECDLAVKANPIINAFLAQQIEDSSTLEQYKQGLLELAEQTGATVSAPDA